MDNLWIIFGKNVRYVRLNTMHDRSLKCCPLRWTHPRTPPRSGLRQSWPQTFLPYHATWDDQKTPEKVASQHGGRPQSDMLNDGVCVYVYIWLIAYIYIYMYSMRSIGKNLRCSQAGIFGKTPKKFCAPSRWPNSWPWNTHQAGPHQNPVLEILAEGAILRILWFHLQVINQLAALTVKKRGQFDCYWNVSLS